MKKSILISVLFLFQSIGFSQDKVLTKTGQTTFEASMPSFEEVKATNKNSICALNLKTGEIASITLIKGFKFKLALMEEHFNENYMESEKFPKATFKGRIENFIAENLTAQKQEYKIKGVFEIHGQLKEKEIIAKISKVNDIITLSSDFSLNTDDFKIDLPFILRSKVAKQVQVSLDYQLQ